MKTFVRAVAWSTLAISCGGSPKSTARPPEPQPRAERLPEVGELDPAKVMFAIRGNETELRKCFFRAPSASGFVRITWRVDRAGVVHDTAIERSTVGNEAVESCLTTKVGELRFGELSEPARAQWTYVFRLARPPGEEPARGAKRKHQRKNRNKKKNKREEVPGDEPGVVIEASSPGRLDPSRVDEVVLSGYKLFARCYRDGFDRNASLSGTVRFRFVVNEQGRVERVLDGESDLSDRRVIDCIAETFYALEFPPPSGGSVQVLYRLQLD